MKFFYSQLKVFFSSVFVRKSHVKDVGQYQLIERLSHELRTSLTGIVGYSEFVESTSTEPMVNFTAKIIKESGQNLARASSSFFDLHRLREGQIKLKLSSFSMSNLVREIVRDHQNLAFERGLNLYFTCTDEAFLLDMKSDKHWIRQVVNTLVFDNVQRGSKNQFVHVNVSFDEDKSYAQLMLSTSVVAVGHLQINLFKEFWADPEYRFRLQEGPGVELAFSRALIYSIGGFVSYNNHDLDKSIQLVVSLPMNATQLKVVYI